MKHKDDLSRKIDKNLNLVIEQITSLSDKQTRHIQNLTRIGVALSSVASLEKIFDLILIEAISFTNADAATIYKVSKDKKYLDFVIVYNRSLNIRMGVEQTPISWDSIPLNDKKGNPLLSHIVSNVYHTKQILAFDDVYEAEGYDISGTKAIDTSNNYRSKSMLSIPLKDHENEILGVLQIINAMDKDENVVAFNNEHKVMLKSLASQAAIAMSNRKLISDLESLLIQFMQAIAKGIEKKSKYSSNHITRVALLVDLIANKINDDKTGKFKDFKFSTSELKEISMAGLMHDVGKIVTPDYVMDKATKLETITDRIHLITLRFELFKKALALSRAENGEEQILSTASKLYPSKKIRNWTSLISNLDMDRAFLGKVNLGGESLTDEDLKNIERIKAIVFEFDGQKYNLVTDDEVENLKIRSGTLTNSERMTMKEHVMITWEMLSEVTFPNKFKNVALYAASHHEKLNGMGYPFGLKDEQLPLQSRILAISDIFEALTAVDRPYKKGIKLSEAMKILAICAKNNEVDSDLLDFILDTGIYIDFAKKHMKQGQIDKIDLNSIKHIYH